MVFEKGLDSLYTSKKDIENIISESSKNEKLGKIIKSKGLSLEKILKYEINTEYGSLNLHIHYKTRDYKNGLISLIQSIEEIKEFSKTTYSSLKFDIGFDKNDNRYKIYCKDEKGNDLFGFNISKNKYSDDDLDNIYLYIDINKKFTENLEFAKELFSIVNNNIIKQVIDSYNSMITVDSEDQNSGLEDIMKELGIENYSADINIENIGGYNDIKDRIEREIFTPFIHKELLSEIRKITRLNNKSEINSALFYGEPGTGKTMMARAIAGENRINFLYLDLSQIYTKWYGESAKRMQTAMELVKAYSNKNGKTVIFIDEIDSLGSRQYGSSESNKVLNTLLTYLSGVKSEDNDNLLFIGCTNLIENVDPALLSRLKSKVYFRKPDKNDRYGIISKYCKKLDNKEIEEFATKSEDLTGRDLESVVSIAEENLAYDLAKGIKDYKTPKLEDYLSALSIFKKYKTEEKSKNNGMYS